MKVGEIGNKTLIRALGGNNYPKLGEWMSNYFPENKDTH